MIVSLLGGGWLSAAGYGRMREGGIPRFPGGEIRLPPADRLFRTPLRRYGRFDPYTRMGCAAVALTVQDAGWADEDAPRDTGLVMATRFGCFGTDLDYHETTLEGDGAFSSPNLFSYTLPGIVLGECAIHFGMTGPSFCVGESNGTSMGEEALAAGLALLAARAAERVIVGWLDAPCPALGEDGPERAGAVFVALEEGDKGGRIAALKFENHRAVVGNRPIVSILDLWPDGIGEGPPGSR